MARKKSATNRTVTQQGYVLLWMPKHHLADSRGYVYEHRLVAEKKLGRDLIPGEQIHHIDGNTQNNNPDNLEVVKGIKKHRFLHRGESSNLRKPDEENPIISCACGCRKKFKKYDRLGRPRKYISGHNLR